MTKWLLWAGPLGRCDSGELSLPEVLLQLCAQWLVHDSSTTVQAPNFPESTNTLKLVKSARVNGRHATVLSVINLVWLT